VVGGVLIVAAVGVAVGMFIWTLSAFLSTDAEISADGRTHHVRVDNDRDRMLWLEDGSAQHCQVVDRATGEDIDLDLVGASYDRSDEDGEWHGVAKFDPGSGDLDVTCAGHGGTALIGPAPRIGSFVLGILATILIPLALGLSGLSILIVTGILFAVRPPRPKEPA
jgi:hypothetical protein